MPTTNIFDILSNNAINVSTSLQNNLTFKLLTITIAIVIYAIFIFKFYKLLAKKNLIELNLNKYNQYSQRAMFKLIASIFFIIEYIIILPFITFFWFTILTTLLFFLADQLPLATVVLLSACLIASVRISAYFSENLSQDLAKMLPFTLLGVAITQPGFFQLAGHLEKISQFPELFTQTFFFLIYIIAIELIMRIYEFIKNVFFEQNALK